MKHTGVSASDLSEGDPQTTLLLDPTRTRRRAIETVTAELRERFGSKGGVTRAALLDTPGRGDFEETLLPRKPD